MGLFTRSEYHESSVHEAMKDAFYHVKKDVFHIFDWLNYFHQKHQHHDQKLNYHDQKLDQIERQLQRLAQEQRQISYAPSHEEVRTLVDQYNLNNPSIIRIQETISSINRRLDLIEQQRHQEPRTSLKERLVRKITKNSKDYIKTVILSLIRKYEQISAPQLKEIVVEEQGLCSKSSFYRMLTELEQENEISGINQGKEKLYLARTSIMK